MTSTNISCSENSNEPKTIETIENEISTEKRSTNKCFQVLFTRTLLCHAIYFALAYFIQGITDIASGFVNLPIQTILKDQLNLSPTEMGTFFFSCTITWSIKPIYGLLSDFFPIFGFHRFSYLLITSIIHFVAWICLFLVEIKYIYLQSFCILAAFSLAFNDVIIDALMISVGRNFELIATFQGIQQSSTKFASTVSQIPAGFFASFSAKSLNSNRNSTENFSSFVEPTKQIFLIASICPIVLFFSTLFLVKERRRKFNRNNFSQTFSTLRKILFVKRFWFVTFFLFFYSSSPQIKTALFYHQRDTLRFDPFYVSILNTIFNGCGIISSIVYLSIFSFYPTQKTLRIAILLKIFGLISYLFALDRLTSIFVSIFTGFCWEITNLAIFHLAAKSCPKNIEGTLFALFVSCVNFGSALGDWIGSIIYENFGFAPVIFTGAVWLSAAIFATCYIAEHGIRSTRDEQEDSEDKYHYYDVIDKKSVRLEQNEQQNQLNILQNEQIL